jgi:hypothetical protein
MNVKFHIVQWFFMFGAFVCILWEVLCLNLSLGQADIRPLFFPEVLTSL